MWFLPYIKLYFGNIDFWGVLIKPYIPEMSPIKLHYWIQLASILLHLYL
jgi:hypothetical protein